MKSHYRTRGSHFTYFVVLPGVFQEKYSTDASKHNNYPTAHGKNVCEPWYPFRFALRKRAKKASARMVSSSQHLLTKIVIFVLYLSHSYASSNNRPIKVLQTYVVSSFREKVKCLRNRIRPRKSPLSPRALHRLVSCQSGHKAEV